MEVQRGRHAVGIDAARFKQRTDSQVGRHQRVLFIQSLFQNLAAAYLSLTAMHLDQMVFYVLLEVMIDSENHRSKLINENQPD